MKRHCWNGCGGHGECFSGVCVCDNGYQGLDCVEKVDEQALLLRSTTTTSKQVDRSSLKIYVYPIPPELTWIASVYHKEATIHMQPDKFRAITGACPHFLDRLLADGAVRACHCCMNTTNPNENSFMNSCHTFSDD